MNSRFAFASSLAGLGVAVWLVGHTEPTVPYPEGYRRWAHVKSGIAAPKGEADPRAGIYHLYANELALRGYETGRFPEGSVIVFDLLATTTEKGGTREGARKLVDVMHKDSTRFAATGGWGYEEFGGDTRHRVIGEPARNACFQCHTQRKTQDYVFSSLRR